MKRPSDNFIEEFYTNYHDVDQLLSQLYPNDADYQVFEGSLVDNFIGYGPHVIQEKNFEYVVILETYLTEWTSGQTVIYTNDTTYVDELLSNFEKDEDC